MRVQVAERTGLGILKEGVSGSGWVCGGETAAADRDVRVEGGARALEKKEIDNNGGAVKVVLRK